MTPQNQGFSSNKTLPKMTCPKSDPVISRFQECVVVNLLLTGQSQKVDCYFLLNKHIYIYMYYNVLYTCVCDSLRFYMKQACQPLANGHTPHV